MRSPRAKALSGTQEPRVRGGLPSHGYRRDTAAQCRPGDGPTPFPESGGTCDDLVLPRRGRQESRSGDVCGCPTRPDIAQRTSIRVVQTLCRRWVCRERHGWGMRSSSPRCWRGAVESGVDGTDWWRRAEAVVEAGAVGVAAVGRGWRRQRRRQWRRWAAPPR